MKRTLFAAGVAALAAVALTFTGASLAASRTTEPTQYRLVAVILSDKGVKLGWYAVTRTHDGNISVPAFIPRGDYVSFSVVNVGKTRHTFKVFGKTVPVRPGQKKHFAVAATSRGKFPYVSTGQGKQYRGFISVV